MHRYLMTALFTLIISCPTSLAFAQESDSGFSQEKIDKLNKEVELLYNQVKESNEKLKALANGLTAKGLSAQEKAEAGKRLDNELKVMTGYENKINDLNSEIEDEYQKISVNMSLDDKADE